MRYTTFNTQLKYLEKYDYTDTYIRTDRENLINISFHFYCKQLIIPHLTINQAFGLSKKLNSKVYFMFCIC